MVFVIKCTCTCIWVNVHIVFNTIMVYPKLVINVEMNVTCNFKNNKLQYIILVGSYYVHKFAVLKILQK